VQEIAVNEQRSHQCPNPALQQIVETKNDILFGESWVLLPGPQAGRDTKEYKESVGSQGISFDFFRTYPGTKLKEKIDFGSVDWTTLST
jgi:hypothetical protein